MTNPKPVIQDIFEPTAIEQESFAIIEAEVPEPRPFQGREWRIVRRLIHATADFELLSLVRFHPRAITAGLEALSSGALVITDTRMAQEGISARRRTELGFTVACAMTDPAVAEAAKSRGCTRAMAAMDLCADMKGPLVLAIGNAPTALLRLLELMRQGALRPALVIGMPVGFVNAAQSKDLLMAQDEVPYIAIQGRKGGSALAAATVNALAEILLEDKRPPS
jgi:precorrin-8X/cobalt-precorrin-8 methylmutase